MRKYLIFFSSVPSSAPGSLELKDEGIIDGPLRSIYAVWSSCGLIES